MKLHQLASGSSNLFTGYGEGYVMINNRRHDTSVVVLPEQILTDWAATTFEALQPEHLASLLKLQREVILLGTGATIRFPRPEILRPLRDAGIGVEVMDVQAACRTYNFLMAEERKVAAALLLG